MIDQNQLWKYIDRSSGPDGHWFYILQHGAQVGALCYYNPPSVRLNGQTKPAHRWAYILTYGDVPSAVLIRHRCGWGGCCNPAHLLPGTHKENAWDIAARARAGAGPDDLWTYEDAL
jgi:hypothetical protein